MAGRSSEFISEPADPYTKNECLMSLVVMCPACQRSVRMAVAIMSYQVRMDRVLR